MAEITEEFYTPGLLRSMPEKIFVFGDNLLQRGTKGQAAIRGEPNAVGVPTKRAPSMLSSPIGKTRRQPYVKRCESCTP